MIIQVGQSIGVWWTIAILIADSMLGALLMRTQGRGGVAALQRGAGGRPRARPRGGRRRARDLRRRAAAHPGLPDRHRRPAVPAPADARADPPRVPAPGDEAHHRLDGAAPRRRPPRRAAARRRRRGHGGRRRPRRDRSRRRGPGSRREHRRARRRGASATRPPTASRSRSATPGAELYGLARLGFSRDAGRRAAGSALALLFSGREPVAGARARRAAGRGRTPAGRT